MKLTLTIVICLFLASCSTTKKTEYSFFIAGHAYGNPSEKANNIGLYKPFKAKTSFINEQKNMKHGFLLGDVVWGQNFWPRTLEDISQFEMPIHVARGNHDGKLDYFEKQFGKSYKKFFVNEDLFIVLDLNLDQWNIAGEQLVFLR
ncbi:MAG: metallophosphoesterase, partial [Bacteroidota bacterium]